MNDVLVSRGRIWKLILLHYSVETRDMADTHNTDLVFRNYNSRYLHKSLLLLLYSTNRNCVFLDSRSRGGLG